MKGQWICPPETTEGCPQFRRVFTGQPAQKAVLRITCVGVYEAELNGMRVGEFIMAPGWTACGRRLQVQSYDVTDLLKDENELRITVGPGWYRNPRAPWQAGLSSPLSVNALSFHEQLPAGLLADLIIDGESIGTDDSWTVWSSPIRQSLLYDGETYDATHTPCKIGAAVVYDGPTDTLVEQQGEQVREQERLRPRAIFKTPKGETVVDFGQEVTGYVSVTLPARSGDRVVLSHAEVLDSDGNFYTDNYRSAKALLTYICKDGVQTYKPHLTFYGFRYVRLDEFPVDAGMDMFEAIAVYSDMKRTGYLTSGNALLNKFFDNVIWGQRGNFLDVPTDCPQRDERLGWTGDAQIFAKTACYQYDAEKFFTKWMADLALSARLDGSVPVVVPDVLDLSGACGWADAAVIVPWEVYRAFGDAQIIRDSFSCMKGHLDYIRNTTSAPDLWRVESVPHYGDWLALDHDEGSYRGATPLAYTCDCYYAYSLSLFIRMGRLVGEDVREYEAQYARTVGAFRKAWTAFPTQTMKVLALAFGLAEQPRKLADALAAQLRSNGHMTTGFLGTPYLLHVLSDWGYADLAYDLLLREEYPSWLYSVRQGATTVWEHMDGIKPDGSFWSRDMNSYNHYAYGSVVDWVFEKAAGISPAQAGYRKVRIAPIPNARLGHLSARYLSRQGEIISHWTYEKESVRYEVVTPADALVVIGNKTYEVRTGSYVFYGPK